MSAVDGGARLEGGDSSLVLTIEGYEFPEIVGDRWDSNWLFVRADVEHGGQRWSEIDAGLTTREGDRIVAWSRSIADGRAIDSPKLSFVEPFLGFELLPDGRCIRVRAGYGRAVFDVPVDASALAAFSAALARQLERFPHRQGT